MPSFLAELPDGHSALPCGEKPALFITDHRGDPPRWLTAEAKTHCARCPVREQCLEYALNAGEPEGVWGGRSAAERRELLLEREVTKRPAR